MRVHRWLCWALCVVMASTGCFVVPKHRRDETVLRAGQYEQRHAPTSEMAVSLLVRDSVIHIAALRSRSCTRVYYQDVAVTEGYVADVVDVGWPSGGADPYAGAVMLLLFLALTPVMLGSAIVTGVVVAATDDKTTRQRVENKKQDYSCAFPEAKLSVVLPSGALVEVDTSAGATSFELPATEPDEGLLHIHAPGATPQTIAYGRVRETCVARRDELYTRALAMAHVDRLTAYLQLPTCGVASDDDYDIEWAWERTVDAARDAARNDCVAADHLGPLLARLAPGHRDRVFAREPAIARCLATPAKHRSQSDCRTKRAAALRRAQQESDRKQRAAMLQSAPRCDVSSR